MVSVQIFGMNNFAATRAAERFFKDRRIAIHFGEIRRFIQRFTLTGIVDRESKAWIDGGLSYMKMADSELLSKIEREPGLLRLPLIRCENRLSVGPDQVAWRDMAAE